ncbi:uncharacterized protein LOC134707452 [Mytilus trossulus]|uniref:uncharacterized protein LOC134707452 n=1 Tax=Mytilus trossulus TaxID=6551 RepID=UPI003004FBC1
MCLVNKDRSPRLFQFMRYFGLFVGCMAKFVSGSIFTFNVYQGDIKSLFNYTQTEVELQSSLLNLGLGIGFIPGVLYDKFGPFWTSAAGLIVSVGSYMLLWSTTKFVPFYKNNSWLMGIYFLLCGLGSAFTYMVALNTNIMNFDKKYRGTIVGLLNSFIAGSPSVFVQIYLHVLTGSGGTKYANFLVFFAILFAVVGIMCMLFLRIYTDDFQDDTIKIIPDNESINGTNTVETYRKESHTGTEMNSISTSQVTSSSCCSNNNDELSDKDSMSLKQIVCNLDYHLFSWMFVFAAAIGLVFLNNLTTISKSVRLSQHDSVLLILIPISNAIVSFSLGFLSDVLKDKIPRMTLLLASCVLFTVSLLLAILKGSAFGVLVISTILCGASTGIIWTLSPTVMSERFCLQNIGRNWGMTILLAAVVGFGIQEIFGHLYDHQLANAQGGNCFGLSCVRGGLIAGLVSGILSVLVCIIYMTKRRIQRFLVQRQRTES